jgi:tripeptide aminopeptidase
MMNTADFHQSLLELACAIQQVPAPTFQEGPRARYLAQRLQEEGLSRLELDAAGNLLACIPGAGRRPLVVSAHLDTVHADLEHPPLKKGKDRITGPGIGDNALGLAALVGLARSIDRGPVSPPGDLWLVATVREEGLGNLDGMQAVVDRFGDQPLAYLVLEGIGLRNVFHRGLGVERYRITVQTAGGHPWLDHHQPSAIHELAALVTHLAAIPLPVSPRTTLNVGTIRGGTTINTIAAEATIDVDLRSESNTLLQGLAEQVQNLAQAIQRPSVKTALELIGRRPAGEIPADHPLVLLAKDCLQRIGAQPILGIASTDANIPLSRGLPAICIGLTSGNHAHTGQEYIDTHPFKAGFQMLSDLVEHIWEQMPDSPG